ncbi:hypothetical protein [Cohnella thermotolerans]|uniref:hypothetical protein n=1 Tax=Cohnella thermotolerans TaxID=329858 RepID=UPI0004242EE9|nr:hypothetical protein [Cohnella thermotolerans]
MRFWQSVRFRIVFRFFLIVAPLVIFLIYNNVYATRIVREQISDVRRSRTRSGRCLPRRSSSDEGAGWHPEVEGREPFGAEQPSAYSDIHFVIVIPEPYILQNLPFFQKMLYYWIPLLSVAVVAGYSNANYGLLWKNEMRAYLNSLTVKLGLGGSSCLCSDHPPEEAR